MQTGTAYTAFFAAGWVLRSDRPDTRHSRELANTKPNTTKRAALSSTFASKTYQREAHCSLYIAHQHPCSC